MKERYKVLGAVLSLREFTVADLSVFSGVKPTTVRTVLSREAELLAEAGKEPSPSKGGQFTRYRLRDDKVDGLRSELHELHRQLGLYVNGGISNGGSGEYSPPLPLVAALDALLLRFPRVTDLNAKIELIKFARSVKAAQSLQDQAGAKGAELLELYLLSLQALIDLSSAELASAERPSLSGYSVSILRDFFVSLLERASRLGQLTFSSGLLSRFLTSPMLGMVTLPGAALNSETSLLSVLQKQSDPRAAEMIRYLRELPRTLPVPLPITEEPHKPTQKPQHRLSRVSFPKSERNAHPGAMVVGRTDLQRNISVSVIVKRKNPLDLTMIGRHLSQEEFSEQYAADPANFDQLRDFAHKHGLTVDESASSLTRRTMALRGPASKIGYAFGVTLDDYQKNAKKFHSYTGTISMPQEHAEPVEAVLGLDNHPIAVPHFRLRNGNKPGTTGDAAQMQSFNPPQVAQLYNFPSGCNGAGQTIGILELGGGYNPRALSSYFAGLGIAEPRVTAVSVNGATNSPDLPSSPSDPNVDCGVALDIEVAGSIAPAANIAVYFTPNTSQGFLDALTTAIHDTTNGPPSVISTSWGSAEVNWTAQSMTAFDEACQSAAALGITITVASGANGSSDGASGDNVDFPASSPHVLGCGGTEIKANGAIQQEIVWNDQPQGGGASGGGVSSVFALPTWQTNANVPSSLTNGGGRGVPDVAGNASPGTGYNVVFDGQSGVVGGTSAVAPLWAALIALLNQRRGSNIGFANPALYQNAERAFTDITQGNNGSYSAGPGWDPCTGLGSPNGSQLSQIFAPSATRATHRYP